MTKMERHKDRQRNMDIGSSLLRGQREIERGSEAHGDW